MGNTSGLNGFSIGSILGTAREVPEPSISKPSTQNPEAHNQFLASWIIVTV
jgi:hypothetical protein